MSATIAHSPNHLLRRALAAAVLAVVIVAVVAGTVRATLPTVHAQVLKDGTTQVSGFDGGATLQPATVR